MPVVTTFTIRTLPEPTIPVVRWSDDACRWGSVDVLLVFNRLNEEFAYNLIVMGSEYPGIDDGDND